MHFSSDACPGNPLAAGLDVRIEIPNAPDVHILSVSASRYSGNGI